MERGISVGIGVNVGVGRGGAVGAEPEPDPSLIVKQPVSEVIKNKDSAIGLKNFTECLHLKGRSRNVSRAQGHDEIRRGGESTPGGLPLILTP